MVNSNSHMLVPRLHLHSHRNTGCSFWAPYGSFIFSAARGTPIYHSTNCSLSFLHKGPSSTGWLYSCSIRNLVLCGYVPRHYSYNMSHTSALLLDKTPMINIYLLLVFFNNCLVLAVCIAFLLLRKALVCHCTHTACSHFGRNGLWSSARKARRIRVLPMASSAGILVSRIGWKNVNSIF